MTKKRAIFTSIVVLCGAFSAVSAVAQSNEDADFEYEFPYLDEEGEEIFGPEYMPDEAPDPGVEQAVGQPAAGYQIPAWAPAVSQKMARSPAALEWEAISPAMLVPLTSSAADRLESPAEPAGKPIDSSAFKSLPGAVAAFDEAPVEALVAPGAMRIHFVYVGQGAGAIVELPCGVAVIDTGGEYGSGDNGGRMFVDYLRAFFAKHPEYDDTIDTLITSHPHKDHLYGLIMMTPRKGGLPFRVRNIVDNGMTGSQGSVKRQTDARTAVRATGGGYSAVEFAGQNSATGTTSRAIDPFPRCKGVDPVFTAFWGGRVNNLRGADYRGPRVDFRNPNNQSVVVRIDFGQSSALFTGDLEDDGIEAMLFEYGANPGVFDVDVLLSSHHGADNGTTDAFIEATSPELVVISMGDRSNQGKTTAWDHGHPRKSALDRLQLQPAVVDGSRPAKTFWAFDTQEVSPPSYRVSKAIYGTGWEGSLVLEMRADGSRSFVQP